MALTPGRGPGRPSQEVRRMLPRERQPWSGLSAASHPSYGAYFLSTSSKNATARGSRDWPSVDMACLRTSGFGVVLTT